MHYLYHIIGCDVICLFFFFSIELGVMEVDTDIFEDCLADIGESFHDALNDPRPLLTLEPTRPVSASYKSFEARNDEESPFSCATNYTARIAPMTSEYNRDIRTTWRALPDSKKGDAATFRHGDWHGRFRWRHNSQARQIPRKGGSTDYNVAVHFLKLQAAAMATQQVAKQAFPWRWKKVALSI